MRITRRSRQCKSPTSIHWPRCRTPQGDGDGFRAIASKDHRRSAAYSSSERQMTLTNKQRLVLKEAQQIANRTKINITNIENIEPMFRLVHLRLAINNMIIAEIVSQYTLMDLILSDLIARYF